MAVLFTALIVVSTVWHMACGGCNQKHAAKPNEVAYITSPGYPANFTEYVDCYYELYSTSDHRGLLVYVDVVDVTLKCDDESTHLHVYDGFSRNPRFLGRICVGGPRTFESPKQTLYLTFRSRTQHAGRSRGFRLRVRTFPKYCHCYTQQTVVLEATSTPALLSSPYYPYGTEPEVNCRWLLKAPEDKRVNATLLHVDMKGSAHCRKFGLFVYDGKTTYDDKLLATVCHNSLQTFQSSGSYLLIVFISGPLVYRSGAGVKLQYSTIAADGSDKQMISQTLFYIITALLTLLIFVIVIITVTRLFFLPKRRKEAERRRRAARVRLTRVHRHSSGQSDSASRSESVRHTTCSRASSSMSGSSVSSQLSRMSLSRLLSLYGLKKCRQEHRCSPAGAASQSLPDCLYTAQRSGVLIRLPQFSLMEAHGILPGDLPPSYEEAVGQGQQLLWPTAVEQVVEERETVRPDLAGGDVREQEQVPHATPGEAETERCLDVALEQAVVAAVMRQSAQEHGTRESSSDPPLHPSAEEEIASQPPQLREITAQIVNLQASSRCSAQQRVTALINPTETLRTNLCGESVTESTPEHTGTPDRVTEDGEAAAAAVATSQTDDCSAASTSAYSDQGSQAAILTEQEAADDATTVPPGLPECRQHRKNIFVSGEQTDRPASTELGHSNTE